MAGPHVVIIVPPLGPGQEPQTITVDIQGPKQVYIIGDGMFGVGFADAESQTFGGGDGDSGAMREALEKAKEKLKGIKGNVIPDQDTPTVPDSPPSTLVPGITEADVQALRDMGFTDEQITDYYKDHPQETQGGGTPAAPVAPGGGVGPAPAGDPKDPMPGVPTPDLKDLESTEQRVDFLEAITEDADKEKLENKKLAFGLYRNAKDEGRQDLVDRICAWLDLPEMIVETQAPKSA